MLKKIITGVLFGIVYLFSCNIAEKKTNTVPSDSSKFTSVILANQHVEEYLGKYTLSDLKAQCYGKDTANIIMLQAGYWRFLDSSIVVISEIDDYHGNYSEICLLTENNNKLFVAARGDFTQITNEGKSRSLFSFACAENWIDTTEYTFSENNHLLVFHQCFPGGFSSELFHETNMMHYMYLFRIGGNKIIQIGEFLIASFYSINTWEDSTHSTSYFQSGKDSTRLFFAKSKSNGYFDIISNSTSFYENDTVSIQTKSKTIYKWDNKVYQKDKTEVISSDTLLLN